MNFAAKLAAALALCLPVAAQAHDAWMVPSSTVLSGANSWITVDAATGDNKFYFNHAPLRLDGLSVVAPDGSAAQAENLGHGKLRNTFDLQLKQNGTYRISVLNEGVLAYWKEDGKAKRYMGKPEDLAQTVPAKATELTVWQSLIRVETFVTAGKPSAIKPLGSGLELAPLTHPNDLYAGESASFQLLQDGKPAAGLNVTLVPSGSRYRDRLGEIAIQTGQDGKFSVKWPQPGLYWLHVQTEDGKVSIPQAQKRRLSYACTLEVLQP